MDEFLERIAESQKCNQRKFFRKAGVILVAAASLLYVETRDKPKGILPERTYVDFNRDGIEDFIEPIEGNIWRACLGTENVGIYDCGEIDMGRRNREDATFFTTESGRSYDIFGNELTE